MYSLIKYVPLSVLRAVARFVALILAKQPKQGLMRTIEMNLMLIDPKLDSKLRRQLAYNILNNQLLSSVESAKSWAMPPQWSIDQIHTVHNLPILEAGLRDPNGMLAIVPHLGTWEMMNAWLNQFGKPTIMYKPTSGKMNEFMLAGRQRLNATLVPTDSSGVKAIFKTLKQGGFSILLPDHVPEQKGGVIVPFFGLPTLTGTLASKLASKTKCSMIGLACIRRDDGAGFDIHCYNFLNEIKNKDKSKHDLYSRDVKTATATLNLAIEKMILPFMSHYMWGYRRFKFIPFTDNPYQLTFSEVQTARLKLLETNADMIISLSNYLSPYGNKY
ncbi:lysophospholipid acyltransferase family protein [Psychrobacter sp. I-STPA10]|uniref:lysophospholipid acyltransferase family protein n=1 Tax=Psychrobacter sp. I-STPA10 TaxID=2585769 RepID=UPI001E4BD8FA|nr:lipid A biosynthesis acyltransferase [Psychrobacter sp. I-STPA10]